VFYLVPKAGICPAMAVGVNSASFHVLPVTLPLPTAPLVPQPAFLNFSAAINVYQSAQTLLTQMNLTNARVACHPVLTATLPPTALVAKTGHIYTLLLDNVCLPASAIPF